jgi:ribosomal protein S18 acetylase RimI-like enzyme
MDETEELLRLSVRALATQMYAAPGIELHMTQACVLGLTDEPLADFNRLTLGRDPDAEGFLVRSVTRARERGNPLQAVMSPHVTGALAPVATRLGLTQIGTSPFMVFRADAPIPPSPPIEVTRALGSALVRNVGDLVAGAFGVERGPIARCIDVCFTETADVEAYIAGSADGFQSTVSMTTTGNTAGVSLMATSPAHQRKGLGRTLLTQVMRDFRRRGVDRFYLGATNAGLPLYESLGFKRVCDLTAWRLNPAP